MTSHTSWQDSCNEIEQSTQNIDTILGSIVNIVERASIHVASNAFASLLRFQILK